MSEPVPMPSLREARIGVSYTVRSSSPSPSEMAASIASSAGFAGVRIVNPEADHIRAFAGSPFPVFLSIPNESVITFGKDILLARDWIVENLVPFVDTVKFTVISLGVDFLKSSFPDDKEKLLMAALNNFFDTLKELQLDIKVSTTFSFEHLMICPPFPPSHAQFSNRIFMLEFLDFIAKIDSVFMFNLYPQELYWSKQHGIPLGFALSENAGHFSYIEDTLIAGRYYGVFDCMLAAVVYAIESVGKGEESRSGYQFHDKIPLIVAETGWPVAKDHEREDIPPVAEDEAEAETEEIAGVYFDNLVKTHLSCLTDYTDYRSRLAYTFIRELFDDDDHKKIDYDDPTALIPYLLTCWGIYTDKGKSKYPRVFYSPPNSDDDDGSNNNNLGISREHRRVKRVVQVYIREV